jgi:hypothetical protein
MTNQENPYESPSACVESINTLPDSVVKKANNIVRDARMAILVGLIPILGLAYIGRLVEWYLLRRRCPILSTDGSTIAKDFRSALSRIWFAALCWPIVIVVLYAYPLIK